MIHIMIMLHRYFEFIIIIIQLSPSFTWRKCGYNYHYVYDKV